MILTRKYLYIIMPTCESCTKIAYYGNDTPRFCRSHKEPTMKNVVIQLCKHSGCTSTSKAFGIPGTKGTHCKKHALPGMVNVINKLCDHKGCTSTSRAFDVPDGKGRFCKDHALSTMTNVASVRCTYSGCDATSRNFDVPGGKGRFCKTHAEAGMVDVRSTTCEHDGCNLRPSYSMKGKPPRFCSKHKEPGMCNRSSCSTGDCKVIAGYNYPGQINVLHCTTHKLEGMINIRVRMCKHAGCKKSASFGIKTPKYCKSHAEEGMKNIMARLCGHDGCNTQPSYNYLGMVPGFCNAHSKEGMVCVIGKGCQYEGCESRSKNYDVPGGKGRFCTKHKDPGMVDVVNPTCEACDSLASYGIPGNKRSRCSRHRKPGMITRPKAKCIVCRKPAFYGKHFVPRHCEVHKAEDDENLVERECMSCKLVMVLDKNNKCEYCDTKRFETNRLAKQNALMDYLNKHGLKGDSTDIIIEHGACGRERPDRTFDFGDKIVILECDEHQHRDRQCECEQTRMVNITQSYGGVPVYFIRWNPDHYACPKPELITKRHKRVADMIQEIRDNTITLPEALLSVTYMYYDGWTGTPTWDVITPWE